MLLGGRERNKNNPALSDHSCRRSIGHAAAAQGSRARATGSALLFPWHKKPWTTRRSRGRAVLSSRPARFPSSATRVCRSLSPHRPPIERSLESDKPPERANAGPVESASPRIATPARHCGRKLFPQPPFRARTFAAPRSVQPPSRPPSLKQQGL